MREILFRGEGISHGCWEYGDLITSMGKTYIGNTLGNHPDDWCQVIPETVGQFTGITDKNGVKIFEGDIVMPKVGHYIVKFNLTSLQWVIEHKSGDHITSLGYNQLIEIVGNIHEK